MYKNGQKTKPAICLMLLYLGASSFFAFKEYLSYSTANGYEIFIAFFFFVAMIGLLCRESDFGKVWINTVAGGILLWAIISCGKEVMYVADRWTSTTNTALLWQKIVASMIVVVVAMMHVSITSGIRKMLTFSFLLLYPLMAIFCFLLSESGPMRYNLNGRGGTVDITFAMYITGVFLSFVSLGMICRISLARILAIVFASVFLVVNIAFWGLSTISVMGNGLGLFFWIALSAFFMAVILSVLHILLLCDEEFSSFFTSSHIAKRNFAISLAVIAMVGLGYSVVSISDPTVKYEEMLNGKNYDMATYAVDRLSKEDSSGSYAILIEALEKKQELRKAIHLALVKSGKKAAPSLLKALEKRQRPHHVSKALGKIAVANPEITTAIMELLSHRNAQTRFGAQDTLVAMGKPGVPLLLKSLNNRRWKAQIVEVLGDIGDPSVERTIIKILHQRYPEASDEARENAVVALGEIGGESSVPELVAFIDNKYNHDTEAIIRSIQKIGTKAHEAVPVLIKFLENKNLRFEAIQALAEVGKNVDSAGVALIEMLNKLEEDRSFETREQIVKALCKIGERPALFSLLEKTLSHPIPKIRICAAQVLTSWGRKELVLPVLLTKDMPISYDFLECVEKIGPEAHELIPILVDHLQPSDEYKKRAVAKTLWAIGEKEQSLKTFAGIMDTKELSQLGKEAVSVIPEIIRQLQKVRAVKVGSYSYGNHPFIRRMGITIGKLGKYSPGCASELMKIYAKQGGWHKLCIAEALLLMGEETAVEWMLKAMRDPENIKDLQECYNEKRRAFLRKGFFYDYTEAAIKNGKGVDALVQGLKDPLEYVRGYTCDVLKKMEDKSTAIPFLVEVIKDEKNERQSRLFAIEILSRTSNKKEVVQPILIEALKDKDAEIRGCAVFALARVAKNDAQMTLKKMLKDDDKWVRDYAKYVLAN